MANGPYSQALLSSPGFYQISVAGKIDAEWADYLHGMTITVVERSDGAGVAVTELSGQLPDQAALMGVLWQLYNLGFTLISVSCKGKKKNTTGRSKNNKVEGVSKPRPI